MWLIGFSKSVPSLSLADPNRWFPGPTSAVNNMDDLSPLSEISAPFSDKMHPHCAINTYLHNMAMNFDGVDKFRP